MQYGGKPRQYLVTSAPETANTSFKTSQASTIKNKPIKVQVTDDQAWAKALGSPPEVIKNLKAPQTSQIVTAIKAMVTEILINRVTSC